MSIDPSSARQKADRPPAPPAIPRPVFSPAIGKIPPEPPADKTTDRPTERNIGGVPLSDWSKYSSYNAINSGTKKDNRPSAPKPVALDGVTLRDWFAGMAMQGLLARSLDGRGDVWVWTAKKAYEQADAMMEARKEK